MSEIIKVAFVNQPKTPTAKSGNIKTEDGRYFGVFANKLSQFTPGASYEIEHKSREYNGKTYHDITSAKLVAAASNGNGAHAVVKDNSGVHWGGCLKNAAIVHQGNAVPASVIIAYACELYAATPTEVTPESTSTTDESTW